MQPTQKTQEPLARHEKEGAHVVVDCVKGHGRQYFVRVFLDDSAQAYEVQEYKEKYVALHMAKFTFERLTQ